MMDGGWKMVKTTSRRMRALSASALLCAEGGGRYRRLAGSVLIRLDVSASPESSATAVRIAEFRMNVPRTVFSPIT